MLGLGKQGERMAEQTPGSQTPGSQSALREANQQRVLRAIRSAGSLTQAQIARTTGLSAATVSNIVRVLRDSGAVVVAPTSSGGRRARSVSLSRDAGLALGVHISSTQLRAAICDMGSQVLAEERIPYQTESAQRTLRRTEWLVNTLLRQARVDRGKIKGAGVAAAVRGDAGALRPAESGWHDLDLADELSDRLGLPIELFDEAHAAALGELI
ncbi:MAG: ROK family transcriptional regulator, partial [Micromonosporaceae bacterium]